MFKIIFSTLLLAFFNLANAIDFAKIEDVITPRTFSVESFFYDSNSYTPTLSTEGTDWFLSAILFSGGGTFKSESYADTAKPRGFLGTHIFGFKDSLKMELNLFLDNAKNCDLKEYKGLYYTGYITYNSDWIHITAGHDAIHYGPGVYNNLTFNRASYAYDVGSIGLDLGPLHVYSFFGSLRVAPWDSDSVFADRDVYGHRYEVRTKNFSIGISEATILYNNNQPWLFIPTVPLFMEKGNYSEGSNNGSISFDVEYCFLGLGRLYTEFFLDDMESPISLIKNEIVESKWAWMFGIQFDKDFEIEGEKLHVGTITEYARVEPYVYSHFIKNTSQMAHAGKPLGNPNGPNSQVIDWSIYAQYGKRFKAILHSKWLWKGTDYGSHFEDETINVFFKKEGFLKGAKMQYSLAPYFCYTVNHITYQLGTRLFNDQETFGNVIVWW